MNDLSHKCMADLTLLCGQFDYTLWSIKTGHYIAGDNFVKCEPISTISALLKRKLNFQQNPCDISHFTLTLIPQSLG